MISGRTVVDGRFELLEPLGSGGMGTVWRAYDLMLHREVALKEVRAADADGAPGSAAVQRERVLREARALARIGHPNVVAIHHIVDSPDLEHPWIVMELVRGRSLADLLAQGPLAPAHAAFLGRGLLAALRAAHATGVLHRDIKPANVLLREDGSPVLTDFGIAAIDGMNGLTSTGSVVGSLDYVAPERLQGEEGHPASDLWSLALVLYVAVEGYHPMRRDTTVATLAAVLKGEVPHPERAGALTTALRALLVPDPNQRPTLDQTDWLLAEVMGTPGATVAPRFDLAPGGPASTSAPGSGSGPIVPQAGAPSVPQAGAVGSRPPLPQGNWGATSPGVPQGAVGGSTSGATPGGWPGTNPATPQAGWAGSGPGGSHPGAMGSGHLGPPAGPMGSAPLPAPPGRRERGLNRWWVITGLATAAVLVAVVSVMSESGDSQSNTGETTGLALPSGIVIPSDLPTGGVVVGPTSTVNTTQGDGVGLLTPDGVRGVIAALEKATGGKQFTETVFYPTYANSGAPLADRPKYYDEYVYRDGTASRKGPGGTLSSGETTVDLSSINWDALPGLWKTAEEKLNVPNPNLRYVIVNPAWTFNDDKPTVLIYLTNEYSGAGYLAADIDGTVIKVYAQE
ncbi:protein kinase [Nocardia sp. 2]|uniref:non-specific serine/threonine protein kinase n=1 Tax=Nocardia acididurans TaxID=2802282 RepID=A0ABS1MFF7_9NOCA|nr:serine/threonine-protein kinase [Nocardia acididurans]MBL1079297.1 protein kinase [Nocardia acididurans]